MVHQEYHKWTLLVVQYKPKVESRGAIVRGSKFGVVVLLMSAWGAATVGSPAKDRARVTFSTPICRLDGSHLKATIVEVHYGPGEASKPHTHSCPVVVYVTQGAIRAQVKGESEAIYHTGQAFYEAPNSVHMISGNASQTEAATFLAYFVCDHESALSVEVPRGESR